jgi:S-adenosylmethionine hydrolase
VERERIRIHFKEIKIQGLSQNYVGADKHTYIALVNSWGLVEIARYNDNAASRSGAKIGDEVRIELLTL